MGFWRLYHVKNGEKSFVDLKSMSPDGKTISGITVNGEEVLFPVSDVDDIHMTVEDENGKLQFLGIGFKKEK